MRFEDEIAQGSFRSEQQKLYLNLIYTANALASKQLVFFKKFKLTPQQYNVLRILRGQKGKPVPVRVVMARMLDKNSNVTRIVDKLEAKGWVSRQTDAVDKRQVLLNITPVGLEKLAVIDPELALVEQGWSTIGDNQAREMNAILDQLRG
jgi:DNA-binding MarR family transcriptional regulator